MTSAGESPVTARVALTEAYVRATEVAGSDVYELMVAVSGIDAPLRMPATAEAVQVIVTVWPGSIRGLLG